MPDFPDTSKCYIGRSKRSGNAGLNTDTENWQQDRRNGFAALLKKALVSSKAEAKEICKETKDKEPCCKKITIIFNGIGVRKGKKGNDELKRRLKGTDQANKGWKDGKKWIVPCSDSKK